LTVNDMTCPWCEAALELPVDQKDDQQCHECLTTWRFEDEKDADFALAA
jgi:hypothetical protein